jgi:excisionase family DNA binding protein
VRDATSTALQSSPSPLEREVEKSFTRTAAYTLAPQPLRPVVNLGRQGLLPTRTQGQHDDGSSNGNNGNTANNVSQAGQAFLDLLLVGCAVSRCPLALLTVVKGEGWSTLSLGAEREALEDPELFDIIARRKEPVEVTDPASNPALSNSRLARSSLGIRWLLGVPLIGPNGEVNAIFAVLDTEPRELSRQERKAMKAIGRLVSGALSAHRATDQIVGPATPPEQANGAKAAPDGHSLLRSHEVAALFDVTERTVINWAASGKLACLRTVGGHLRFRSEDVMSLLEANSLRRPPGV